MKMCTRCNTLKSIESFSFRNKVKNWRQPYCKTCRKTIDAKLWQSRPQMRIQKVANSKSYLKRNQDFIISYLLEHPCVDCGEKEPLFLDFDHQGDKIKDVSKMLQNHSIIMIEQEIAKCEVRCVKCHRLRTAKQFGWFKLSNFYQGVA